MSYVVDASSSVRSGAVGRAMSVASSAQILPTAQGMSEEQKQLIQWMKRAIRLKGYKPSKWSENHDASAYQFFAEYQCRKIIAYVAADGELVLLTYFTILPVAPKSFQYFIKRTPAHDTSSITIGTVRNMVQTGYINGGGVHSLLRIMSDVFMPALKAPTTPWPESVKRDFFGHAQRFMASLVETHHQVRGNTVLYVPTEPLPDDISSAAGDKELLQRLEATVVHWTRQIKEVITNQDASELEQEGLGVGIGASGANSGSPLEEIEFFAARCDDLSGVAEQLKSPVLQKIIHLLSQAGSAYLDQFQDLAESITRGHAAALDNLRFLSILREPCEQLAKAHPRDVPALLPDILNRVRVIGAASKHYCTDERIVGLLRKVSSEILRRCASSVNIATVFEGNPEEAIAALKECIQCCSLWREHYDRTVAAVARNPGARNFRWSFDATSIFAPLDAFSQRCKDLIEVAEAQQQFARKTVPGSPESAPIPCFGGVKGLDIVRSLVGIVDTFEKYMAMLRGVEASALDVKATDWSEVFAVVKVGLKDLDTLFANVIGDAFNGITSIPACVDLLDAFASLARRPAVRATVQKKAVEVFLLFSKQIADTKAYFEANLESPPLDPKDAKFSGAAAWAHRIQSRMAEEWNLLKKTTHFLQPSRSFQETEDAWERFNTGLEEYQRTQYSDWTKTLADMDATRVTERLNVPLFARCVSPEAAEEAAKPSANGAASSSSATASASGTEGVSRSNATGSLPNAATGASSETAATAGARQLRASEMRYLKCNFDARLASLLHEVEGWESFSGNFLIPFFAVDLVRTQGEQLRLLRATVLSVVADYNSLISSLDDVDARLFADLIRRLDRRYLPSLRSVTWSTKGARESVLRDLKKVTLEAWTVTQAFKKDRVLISKLLEEMKSICLVNIERGFVHEEGVFEERQSTHRRKCIQQLETIHSTMVETLVRLYNIFQAEPVPVQKAWARWVRQQDRRVESALRYSVFNSIADFRRALYRDRRSEADIGDGVGDRGSLNETKEPVFKITLLLDEDDMVFRPSFADLENSILTTADYAVSMIKAVPRLEEVLPKVIPNYLATEAAIRSAVSAMTSAGLGATSFMRSLDDDTLADFAAEAQAPYNQAQHAPATASAPSAVAAAPATPAPGADLVSGGGANAAGALASLPSYRATFYDIIRAELDAKGEQGGTVGLIPGLARDRIEAEKRRDEISDTFGRLGPFPSLDERGKHMVTCLLWKADKVGSIKRAMKLEQLEKCILYWEDVARKNIREDMENFFVRGYVQVDLTVLKATLTRHCQEWQDTYLTIINDTARKDLDFLHERFISMREMLMQPPTTFEMYQNHMNLVNEIRNERAAYEERFPALEAYYAVLEKHDYTIEEEELAKLQSLPGIWQSLLQALETGEQHLVQAKIKMKKETSEGITVFASELRDLATLARDELPYEKKCDVIDAFRVLNAWKSRLQEMRARLTNLQFGMQVFDVPSPDTKAIDEVEGDISALTKIWELYKQWETDWFSWKTVPFAKLDVANMEESAAKYRQRLVRLREHKAWGVWQSLDSVIKEFLTTLPLIQALSNPIMRDRHWRQLSSELKLRRVFDPQSKEFTLEKITQSGFNKHEEFIADLSATASKEYAIESQLGKIEEAWSTMEIDLVEYKQVYFRVRPSEELYQLLDDNLVNVSTMKASPYYNTFAKQLDEWEARLARISECLDMQMAVQRQWIYLESIFMGTEEIKKQLVVEAAEFEYVNRTFLATMERIAADPNAVVVCSHPRYLPDLESMSERLGRIEKKLNDYLETKRREFPRFYFLSNDDLLEILGQSRDPMQVQKHIKKCFEGIQTLQLFEPGAAPGGTNRVWEAHGMISPDGERVPFTMKVITEGAVEKWLIRIEDCMRLSLQESVSLCIPAARTKDKLKWIRDFPGQLLITTGMIYFVLNCEKQLRSDTPQQGLRLIRRKQIAYLNKLSDIVRENLDKVTRKKVVALITMELHARDVMERLIRAGCTSVESFDWLSQLRLEYLKKDPKGGSYGTIEAKQTKSVLEYGFEYQGNNGRLVITPLTDRCVLTLTTALYMQRGGAPAGPAGTGKTETVKDLGKNLAKFVVVFNCSDGLDYISVGRMFSGLVQSGGWGCFDEFNRIEVEVLSVVAQQVLAIMEAIRAKKTHFVFMDDPQPITCNHQCGLFITMNPGYAGRSELPDNLKSLFRPVAMMVPDLALIAEVMLQSEGFQNSRVLAKKTVTLYSLMVQQLSKQDHYDYGLRSLRGVLVCAGGLKRKDPTGSEEYIVLRAIRDMNLPKFIKVDAELFRLLLGDLFPSLDLPPFEPGALGEAVAREMKAAQLQESELIVRKCVELYDSKTTRHCNMLVGRTLAGKSTTWKMLSAALNTLANEKVDGFNRVRVEAINPKSITMSELYGSYSTSDGSGEWNDGILSAVFRNFASEYDKPEEKWVLLDGPIDTLWIESMNTVMDDNRTLTLINSDRIGLTEWMSLLFEVQDLSEASPATVSRAGMIYIDSSDLGYAPFVESWIQRVFSSAPVEKNTLPGFFEKYVPRLLAFKAKECKEILPLLDFHVVINLCNLFESFWTPENGLGLHALKSMLSRDPNSEMQYISYLEKWFTFACTWSLGAVLDETSRRKFNEILREITPFYPPTGTVYAYYPDPATHTFKLWTDRCSASWRPPRDVPFSSIIVPTVDTVRNTFVIDALVQKQVNMILVGNTGTGKTVLAQQMLDDLDASTFTRLKLFFSATISSHAVQNTIEEQLDKRSKNRLGPFGGRRMVILIDDFNMPARDTFGSQPPLELLRQWIDYGGWYDRGKQFWKQIVDIQLVAAMGPPGGGRNPISDRLLSRFYVFNFTSPSERTIRLIYETILTSRLDAFTEDVKRTIPVLVGATIAVYNRVLESFLPTPKNSHYLFSLRDIARVMQGVLATNKEDTTTREDVLRLWAHESLRVFSDRLTSAQDLNRFRSILDSALSKTADLYYKQLFEGCENTDLGPVYVDFMGSSLTVDAENVERYPYAEIPGSLDALRVSVEEEMIEYNSTPGYVPLNIVFFKDALRHVAKLHRILRTPGGHAIAVGVGGFGRQTLTRVAAFLTKNTEGKRMGIFGIEVMKVYNLSHFREDMKKLFHQTGVQDKPTCFLLADSQIKHEIFLEDINNILNSGEIPNLYQKDEKVAIIEELRIAVKKLGIPGLSNASGDELWKYFISNVRNNLHLVLTMSPIGDSFRKRLRMFPSLINCATMDWFHQWPRDALQEVALKFLEKVEFPSAPGAEHKDPNEPFSKPGTANSGVALDAAVMDDIRSRISDVFAYAHQTVVQASERMLLTQNRVSYVTPTNFLELVEGYCQLLGEKKKELGNARDKLANGLAKLQSSKEQVEVLQLSLAEKQKIVEKASVECDNLLVTIVNEKQIADDQRARVEEDSARIAIEAAKCEEIAADAQRDLEAAKPILEAAIQEVEKLDSASVAEVKAYSKPSPGVALTLDAVLTLFGRPTGWHEARRKLGESDFLSQVKNYLQNNPNIPSSLLLKLKKYTDDPLFVPSEIEKASKAAAALCSWVIAMESYAVIYREVEPKRLAQKAAEELLASKKESLARSEKVLAEVIEKVNQLNQRHMASVEEKNRLAQEAATLAGNLERAQDLIGGLAGERIRWEESILQYNASLQALPGDALLAAAFLSYAGPFDVAFRGDLVQRWMDRVKDLTIPVDPHFNFASFLADPTLLRTWVLQGLPSDQFSAENGVIVTRGRRWPLMIDPQGQANQWIRNMEAKRNLRVADLKAKNLMRELEQAISHGAPFLLQDVEEEIDPALEPVLSRALLKVGSRYLIKLGDKLIDFHPQFRLYITTKLPNPSYPPEISTRMALVNFAVREEGLEAQLLGTVVSLEEPDLERQKGELVTMVANGKKRLAELEDTILRLLNESTGNLLDDVELVKTLQDSKATSEEVSRSLRTAEETEQKIDVAREGYRPVAARASMLFFTLNSLAAVDPMYQFSLETYMTLFESSIRDSGVEALRAKSVAQIFDEGLDSDPTALLRQRIEVINDWHTYAVYKHACRGLFEHHKLLLAFLICIRKALSEPGQNTVPQDVYHYFLTGTAANGKHKNDEGSYPPADWITPEMWESVQALDRLDITSGIASAIEQSSKAWHQWYTSTSPEKESLPGDWSVRGDGFVRLAIVRCLRPDRVIPSVTRYISASLGPQYVDPPPFDLKSVYESSSATMPLLFILTPGVDPTSDVFNIANNLGVHLDVCSLGQGQSVSATRLIQEALRSGDWVFLQNCHLSISWLPELEKIIKTYCNAYNENEKRKKNPAFFKQADAQGRGSGTQSNDPFDVVPHPSFRLWLSSSPHPKFPISILQNSLKLTTEPPRGLRANLLRLYTLIEPEEFSDLCVTIPQRYSKLLFSLCWFHSILLERRKFKSLGYNFPYDFNDSDWRICADILVEYLSTTTPESTPWAALRYLIAEVNYGGRVTDNVDRLLVNTYTNQFFNESAIDSNIFYLSSLPDYYIPEVSGTKETGYNLDSIKEYIHSLPLSDLPEAFGQHPNADIQSAVQDTEDLLSTLVSLTSKKEISASSSDEQRVMAIAKELEKQLPNPFDYDIVRTTVTPMSYPEPLKVVLFQEIERYNKLLYTLQETLANLQLGLAGSIVITAELEEINSALALGRVPSSWLFAYPSLKPLSSWYRDLLARIAQLSKWVNSGPPHSYWLGGLTYPTGFLTALLQSYARSTGTAIDQLEFDFIIVQHPLEAIRSGPSIEEGGAYVHGMYLEGAGWDMKEGVMDEPLPMMLYTAMPVIHFKPAEIRKINVNSSSGSVRAVPTFKCPLYLYPVRTGTRERPSFMIHVNLPTGKNPPEHWIKRGAALLLSLAT